MAKPGARAAPIQQQAFRGARSASRSSAPQMSVGLYFSTTTGNTETVAGYIADLTGAEAKDPTDATAEEMLAHDAIIVGAPTWHTGADTERSGTAWDEFIYGDIFCDAMDELKSCFEGQGAEVVGSWSTDGYD